MIIAVILVFVGASIVLHNPILGVFVALGYAWQRERREKREEEQEAEQSTEAGESNE